MNRLIAFLVVAGAAIVASQTIDLEKSVAMLSSAEGLYRISLNEEIKKLSDKLNGLDKKVNSLRAHAHVEPNYSDTIVCVKDNKFDYSDEDGQRYNLVEIPFDNAYLNVPKVISTIEILKLGNASTGVHFEQRVLNVTETGLTIRCGASNQTDVERMTVKYISLPSAM